MYAQWQRIEMDWQLSGNTAYVLFINGKMGIYASDNMRAGILETSNGGISWTNISSKDTFQVVNPVRPALKSLGGNKYIAVFYNAIVIGEFGRGYKVKRFVHWDSTLPCVYNTGFSDVSVVDNKHIWVASGYGFVYSGDAGETWECRAPNTHGYFRYAKFIDSLHGVSLGAYTKDGGRNWSASKFIGFGRREFYGVLLNASHSAFLVGSSVYRSDDSGSSFHSLFENVYSCSSYAFCDGEYGWIGCHAKSMQTTNGGTDWSVIEDDSLFRPSQINITGVCSVSCDTVFAVEGSYLYYNFNARNLVSVEEKESSGIAGFQIYPNPTDGLITISTTKDVVSATVVDMLGNVVMSVGFE